MADEEHEEILEGAWDCAQCRLTGIPGGERVCPRCSDPRNPLLDPTEAEYLPDGARVVTDDAERAQALSGPNWNCGHCGTENLGTVNVCEQCGAPKDYKADVHQVVTYVAGDAADGADLVDPDQLVTDRTDAVLTGADPLHELDDTPVVLPDRTLAASEIPRHGTGGRIYGEGPPGDEATSSGAPSRWRRPRFLALIAGALVVVVGAVVASVLIYQNSYATHPVKLRVVSTTWERQIGVDQGRIITQRGWTVPLGGQILSSRQAVHNYKKVVDHYVPATKQGSKQVQHGTKDKKYNCRTTTKNLGNGHYSKSTKCSHKQVPNMVTTHFPVPYQSPVYKKVPVYATYYTYDITRWHHDHYVTAQGAANPYWPVPDNRGPLQRVGGERQVYQVVLVDSSGRRYDRSIPESVWLRMHAGEALRGAETKHGSLRTIGWPGS